MGTIHVLNNVKIYLYFGEHNPPHIHAKYAEYEASIIISSGEILKGSLPGKQLKMVRQWLKSSDEVREKLTLMFQNFNPHLRG